MVYSKTYPLVISHYTYESLIRNKDKTKARSLNCEGGIPKEEEKIVEVGYLYNIVIVGKYGNILLDEKAVAKNKDEVIFGLDVHKRLKDEGQRLSDVTIIIRELGEVNIREGYL